MTPEWSRHAGMVLASPYWDKKGDTDKDYDERMRQREEELWPLKDAIAATDSYDDLSPEMKAIFDRAEAALIAEIKRQEEFAQNDVEGYGRFHSTEI